MLPAFFLSGPNGANLFYFLSSLPLIPPSHHGSVWLLPIFSLLLTNTVSRVRSCLSCGRRGFVGTTKKTSVGLLVLITRCFHPSMFSFLSINQIPILFLVSLLIPLSIAVASSFFVAPYFLHVAKKIRISGLRIFCRF
jgi:hypothetical protein